MSPARTSETPSDVNLQRTRETFLFTREQVAAHTQGTADLAPRHWAARPRRGAHPATDAPDIRRPLAAR